MENRYSGSSWEIINTKFLDVIIPKLYELNCQFVEAEWLDYGFLGYGLKIRLIDNITNMKTELLILDWEIDRWSLAKNKRASGYLADLILAKAFDTCIEIPASDEEVLDAFVFDLSEDLFI